MVSSGFISHRTISHYLSLSATFCHRHLRNANILHSSNTKTEILVGSRTNTGGLTHKYSQYKNTNTGWVHLLQDDLSHTGQSATIYLRHLRNASKHTTQIHKYTGNTRTNTICPYLPHSEHSTSQKSQYTTLHIYHNR